MSNGDRECARCHHGHHSRHVDRRISPWHGFEEPTSLLGWFDNQMSRMQDDLSRHRFFDLPHAARLASDPARRSRLFDALFDDNFMGVAESQPRFHENTEKSQLECQLNTGCGDFFRPEDVEVNISGRNVEFKARREEKSEDGNSYSVREVRRMFSVPENANIDQLNAEMGANGKLMITAPMLTPAVEAAKGPVQIKINRK